MYIAIRCIKKYIPVVIMAGILFACSSPVVATLNGPQETQINETQMIVETEQPTRDFRPKEESQTAVATSTRVNNGIATVVDGMTCLPPLFTLAYPDRDQNPGMIPPGLLPSDTSAFEIPPFWEAQLSELQLQIWPDPQPLSNNPGLRSDLITTNGNDIWFSDSHFIFRYDQESGTISTYKIFNSGTVKDLYVDSRGTIWVLIDLSPLSNSSPLLKFNPSRDLFEAVLDVNHSLSTDINNRAGQILGESEGKLWVIVSSQLYLFDPHTKEAKVLLGADKGLRIYHAAVASSEGKIWFVGDDNNHPDDVLIYIFDPETNQIQIVGPPPGGGLGLNKEAIKLAIDLAGRVWVNELGWFEPKPAEPSSSQLYQIRSFRLFSTPVFIVEGLKYRYVLISPSSLKALSDGSIWYSSLAGIVRLNPHTNDWCIIARGVPNIAVAEDSNGAIWFVYGQLYKYSAENK